MPMVVAILNANRTGKVAGGKVGGDCAVDVGHLHRLASKKKEKKTTLT